MALDKTTGATVQKKKRKSAPAHANLAAALGASRAMVPRPIPRSKRKRKRKTEDYTGRRPAYGKSDVLEYLKTPDSWRGIYRPETTTFFNPSAKLDTTQVRDLRGISPATLRMMRSARVRRRH